MSWSVIDYPDSKTFRTRSINSCPRTLHIRLIHEMTSSNVTIWHRKRRWLGHVLRHDNLLYDIMEGKMLGKATSGRKRMDLMHDMREGRYYGQLKELISDKSRWRQDSKWECMSETCWKQQKTKEEERKAHIFSIRVSAVWFDEAVDCL